MQKRSRKPACTSDRIFTSDISTQANLRLLWFRNHILKWIELHISSEDLSYAKGVARKTIIECMHVLNACGCA